MLQTLLILPLISFLFLSVFTFFRLHNHTLKMILMIFATSLMGFCSLIAFYLFISYFVLEQPAQVINMFNWIDIGDLNINFSLLANKLTVLMVLVVCLVSFTVHLYSIDYIKKHRSSLRFFSYLSLFIFAMNLLVLSNNMLQFFIGWELISVVSYLLIAFDYERSSATKHALKAFLINSLSDVALIIAMVIIFINLGDLSFVEITKNADVLKDLGVIDTIVFLIIVACSAKSAQFGFHTWLPDAMKAPTPASALIHAATMVTAGVFLICTLSSLFVYSQLSYLLIIIGISTSIFTAIFAFVEHDLKKILAYSTSSQLGFMFFACGLGAYNAAIFHLISHSFFKAVLFLTSGNIIASGNGQQDITKMGNLQKILPLSYIFMWAGSLAMLGVPPFSGFFSKEFIFDAMLLSDFGYGIYILGIIISILTAIYVARLMILVFYKDEEKIINEDNYYNDSKPTQALPIIILIAISLLASVLAFIIVDADFWNQIMFNKINYTESNINFFFKLIPLLFVILALYIYYYLTVKNNFKLKLVNTLYHKLYIDQFYEFVLIKPFNLICYLCKLFEEKIMDKISDSISSFVFCLSSLLKKMQTGNIYSYNLFILVVISLVLLVTIFLCVS